MNYSHRPIILHFFGVSALGGSELGGLATIRRQPQFEHRALFLEPRGPATDLYAGAGIAVSSLGLGRGGPLLAPRRLGAYLARTPPDLVYAYGLRPSLLVRLRSPRPALVQAVHSVDAHRPGWQAFLDRRTARRVDRYLVNTEAGRHFLATERGVDRARIRVVPSAIDVEPFATAAATRRGAARAALGIHDETPVILTVANLRPPKGLDVLLEAAAHLATGDHALAPRFLWLVAGDGPLAASLARDLEHRGLHDRVRLLGFRRDTPDLFAAADIFCLTSRREGMPVAILEAMAAGRPVVATDVGGVGEIVADGDTGLLVPPDNAKVVAQALAVLLADPHRAARLGAAGAARVRARHMIESAAAAIAAVYDEVLGDRTREPALSPPEAKSPGISRSAR